jgi:hypothetical protein
VAFFPPFFPTHGYQSIFSSYFAPLVLSPFPQPPPPPLNLKLGPGGDPLCIFKSCRPSVHIYWRDLLAFCLACGTVNLAALRLHRVSCVVTCSSPDCAIISNCCAIFSCVYYTAGHSVQSDRTLFCCFCFL